MPRYPLTPNDMAALVAYLKRLGADTVSGVSDRMIRVATILPTQGPQAAIGQAVRAVLAAYFDQLNAQGGIYRRRVELQVAEVGGDRDTTLATTERLVDEPVFALVSPFVAGMEREMAALAEHKEIPLIGPLTLFPQTDVADGRYSYYVFSGIVEQGRTLVDYAAENLKLRGFPAIVIFPESELFENTANALETQTRLHGWAAISKWGYRPEHFDALAAELASRPADTAVIFFLGSGEELKALLHKAAANDWFPQVFVPGPLIANMLFELPPVMDDRIYLAFPTLPSDVSRDGASAFQALGDSTAPNSPAINEITAYCAARILVQGLKLAGRNVTRKKFLAAIEELREFDTGLAPGLSFGPNRHIGAPGAYLVKPDLAHRTLVPLGGWRLPK